MLAVLFGDEHGLSELFDLVNAEAALLFLSGQLAHTIGWIVGNDVETFGVREETLQCRNGPCRDTAATGGCSAPARAARLCRLPGRNVRLHALDVGELERADLTAAEQRLDVRLDPAPIHGQSSRLDGAIAAPKDAACLGFRQIPVAHIHDRDRLAGARGLFGRVRPAGDGAELDFGLVAGLLDRQHPVAPDQDASAAAFRVSVLEDERLQT